MSTAFTFKQFSIEQNDAAMKLGIDSVILGAMVQQENPKQILDIGTGTGILALMMAQKFQNAQITAIEMDEKAYLNACRNFQKSVFSTQIVPLHQRLQNYPSNQAFDVIICNPPYFTEDIKPDDLSRKTARHADSLSILEIMHFAKESLAEKGSLWTIFPSKNWQTYEEVVLKAGLFVHEKMDIIHSAHKNAKRFVAKVGLQYQSAEYTSLTIKQNNEYTRAFRELTEDFYLHF